MVEELVEGVKLVVLEEIVVDCVVVLVLGELGLEGVVLVEVDESVVK